MKKITFFLMAVCCALPLFAQEKGKIEIPDLKGYVTLKCDFHMHTIFSDGSVWPTVRIDEAYREGIDAIAITDHLEGRQYLRDLEKLTNLSIKGISHNAAYELALPYAKTKGIILIRGSEISRAMPPGHHNAIFLTNSDELDKSDYMDAFRAAKTQNAFIFWNHPGWLAQQPDTTRWFEEHSKLLEQGMMHGIEVVNGIAGGGYYTEAHRWCLEKKLTMIGNTDVHGPMQSFMPGSHLTMTLVFARNATLEAIYEALMDRRTAVYHNEFIIGEEKYLKELFENAVDIKVTKTNKTAIITLTNKSGLTFYLKSANHDARIVYFRNTAIEPAILTPHSTFTISVRLNDGITGGDVNFSVENFLVKPDTGMNYTVKIEK